MDIDLRIIRDHLISHQNSLIEVKFQHVPSHQGIKYNEIADQLAGGPLCNPINSNLKAQTFRDIVRRRVPSKTKMRIPSLFPSRVDNIFYYRIKSNSLILRKEEFTWHKRADQCCKFCNSIPESLNHLIFECQHIQKEVSNIRRIFREAYLQPDIDVLLLSSLPANTERHLYKSIFDFLRQNDICK